MNKFVTLKSISYLQNNEFFLPDDLGGELKELNAAYKKLKQEGDQYESDNSYEEGRLMPLLGSSADTTTWDDK